MRERLRELEQEAQGTQPCSVADLAEATISPADSPVIGVVQEALRQFEETSEIPIEYLKENGLWDAWRAAAERAVDRVPASEDPRTDMAKLIEEMVNQFREVMERQS